jgi:hypothetical protein
MYSLLERLEGRCAIRIVSPFGREVTLDAAAASNLVEFDNSISERHDSNLKRSAVGHRLEGGDEIIPKGSCSRLQKPGNPETGET